jgi:hypothetical protein
VSEREELEWPDSDMPMLRAYDEIEEETLQKVQALIEEAKAKKGLVTVLTRR